MGLADVLGEGVFRTQAQAGDNIQFGVSCCKEYDGQFWAATAQITAQFIATLYIIPEAPIANGQIRKLPAKGAARRLAVAEQGHTEALALQGIAIVCSDGRFIFYDSNVMRHAVRLTSL